MSTALRRTRLAQRLLATLTTSLLTASMVACNLLADPREVRKPKCNDDEDCDDGKVCNGLERCAPDEPDADRLGCVASTGVAGDDGIACTVDVCDEEAGIILNDPANCECQGNIQCPVPEGQPCMVGVCNLDTYTCLVQPRPEGAPCDDGVACTAQTVCTSGRCLASSPEVYLDDSVCDDGAYCNGQERCDPSAGGADPTTGCVSSTPPALEPSDLKDVACAVVLCDEETDTLHPDYTGCPCSGPEDCLERNANTQCRTFLCNAETGWRCEVDRDQDLSEGTPCDDGIACTVGETCNGAGRCVGTNLDAWCQTADPCVGRCLPGNAVADAEGCVAEPVLPVPDACR